MVLGIRFVVIYERIQKKQTTKMFFKELFEKGSHNLALIGSAEFMLKILCTCMLHINIFPFLFWVNAGLLSLPLNFSFVQLFSDLNIALFYQNYTPFSTIMLFRFIDFRLASQHWDSLSYVNILIVNIFRSFLPIKSVMIIIMLLIIHK